MKNNCEEEWKHMITGANDFEQRGVPDPAAGAGEQDSRHPEDYCHRCGGPNISWYAPSLLWNQFVRAKGEPEIICPICFARLAKEVSTTWSMVPDTVTSDYDERLAVRAAKRISNATRQDEAEIAAIVRDALVQSAAALAAAGSKDPCAEAYMVGFEFRRQEEEEDGKLATG